MLHIALYCDGQTEADQIRQYIERTDHILEPVRVETFVSSDDFLKYVTGNPYLVMIVAKSGMDSAQIIQRARKNNPNARLLWFSDEDCVLLAYQFRVNFYSEDPISEDRLNLALQRVLA